MKDLVLLETGSKDPHFNLAFEEYILTEKFDNDFLILWQNRSTVVIGRNQNALEEINVEFIDENGIDVVRRTTGGGAVYHDLGNLNYSFICDYGDVETMTIERFFMPVVNALKELGLNAEVSGRNDILVNGAKVSGTAQRLFKNRILHHGTLLFDSDLDTVASALNVNPDKFASKSVKSVRSRVGNIRTFLDTDMDIDQFRHHIVNSVCRSGSICIEISENDRKRIEEIKRAKYDLRSWNYGHSPRYEMKNRKRWPGGTLEVRMTVEKGIIAGISFSGDFLSLRDLSDLSSELVGVENSREEIHKVLEGFKLKELFGSITEEQILDTVGGCD